MAPSSNKVFFRVCMAVEYSRVIFDLHFTLGIVKFMMKNVAS